jgi:hypothetical protein
MSTAEDRKIIRVTGANGRPFALDAREHGVSVAWSYWYCECDPCLAGRNEAAKQSYFRRLHNRRILEQIQRDHALPGTPAPQSADAPEHRKLMDEAERDGSPHSAPAPPTAGQVQPTQQPDAPGQPTYLDRVRARLRAAGLGA